MDPSVCSNDKLKKFILSGFVTTNQVFACINNNK